MIGKLKQKETGLATTALIVAGVAIGGAVVLSARTTRLEKQVAQLTEMTRMNATVALGLSNVVARELKIGDNQ